MSNLYKGAFIRIKQDAAPVTIDTNGLFEQRVEEKRQKELNRLAQAGLSGESEEPPTEADFEGLDPSQLEQLTADPALYQAAQEEGAYTQMPGMPSEEEIEAANAQLEQMRAEAEQIIENAQREADAIREAARMQGHDEGYQAGLAEAAAGNKAQEDAIRARAQELEEEYRRMVESAEPEMVDTLTRIYEHIFGVRLAQDKQVILHLLSQTLMRAEPSGEFLIHVSSADYDEILDARETLKGSLPNPNCSLEIVEDSFLKENECMVETDGGVFDCSLGTELSELAKKLQLLSMSDRK